ncbi:MAG: outer membrane beta-barrel protein, partial [Prevotella sp.]
DLGLRKTFLNKMFSFSANWRDVFNSRRWKNVTETESFTRYQENWRDPRVNFTLTWNFGNMNSKKKQQKNDDMNGSEEEQQSYGGYE